MEDVAIIGMACLLPGAPDVDAFWGNVRDGVCAISEPPDDWYAGLGSNGDGDGAGGKLYATAGGYLKELAAFDPLAYGVMPRSVDGSEPDQFLALRVGHEAMADAGYLERPFDRERTEVIIGRGTYFNRGYVTLVQRGLIVDQTVAVLRRLHPEHTQAELAEIRAELEAGLPPLSPETVPGLVPNVMCGRVMNRLDLMGANFTVDAACASSLIALDLGVEHLRAGRCDLALVGGVQVSTPPLIYLVFCLLDALSRQQRLLPFDRRADGTLLGEGLGILVLKRRRDAERDGDRVVALVKGVGTASDGRALGLLAPRVEGEELAIRRAYQQTGIDPRTIGLLEAHGTATPVGDAVEVEAVNRVFGPPADDGPHIALGSVKSMIGHIIPASASAGVIKTALALRDKVLPPTLCDEPNPELGLERGACYLNTETRPWVHGAGHPRRAGVNAFGFGGINAHAILEEYDADGAHV
jgi:acyl transferase domain-containing protein